MFDKFQNNNSQDEDIVVLSEPEPMACGGTRATQNRNAPTVIESHAMYLFEASSALGGMVSLDPNAPKARFGYLSAFAAAADGGSFLYLRTRPVYSFNELDSVAFALVKEDVFPALDRLVREQDLAKGNGLHSYTNGLPQNFGGSVNIRYESGECISFSNNQSPILSPAAANGIADLFEKAIAGEKLPLPSVELLREIRFYEDHGDGGFTKATLTLNPDGTGVNQKAACYDVGQVFESEKQVDAETVEAIKRNVTNCGMLCWDRLPRSESAIGGEKTMTFVLDGGAQIAVTNQKALPMALSGGFFNIELEMTTRH